MGASVAPSSLGHLYRIALLFKELIAKHDFGQKDER
jgi:hypothetical protein